MLQIVAYGAFWCGRCTLKSCVVYLFLKTVPHLPCSYLFYNDNYYLRKACVVTGIYYFIKIWRIYDKQRVCERSAIIKCIAPFVDSNGHICYTYRYALGYATLSNVGLGCVPKLVLR